MSRTIPIIFTPAEIADDLTEIVRAAVECSACGGAGWILDYPRDQNGEFTGEGQNFSCDDCHGTGYLPCPLGEPGDVLFHQEALVGIFLGDGRWEVNYESDGAGVDLWQATIEEQESFYFPSQSNKRLPADTMPEWASRYRYTRVSDARLVRLWEIGFDLSKVMGVRLSATEACMGTNMPENYMRAARKAWDANNPDRPWASNPMVLVAGVER